MIDPKTIKPEWMRETASQMLCEWLDGAYAHVGQDGPEVHIVLTKELEDDALMFHVADADMRTILKHFEVHLQVVEVPDDAQ